MVNSNLRSWPKGVSGNPKGRPKGSRNFKNIVTELMESDILYDALPYTALAKHTHTPLEAIVTALALKAMHGDVRAADVILKYYNHGKSYTKAQQHSQYSKSDLKVTYIYE